MKDKVLSLIDFFYPPFRKIMPLQTFRYAACGSTNVAFNNIVVFAILNHLFEKQGVVHFWFFTFASNNFALVLSSICTFIIGFTLNKYVVFTSSNIKGSVQLFRYFLAFLFSLSLNYMLLNKLFKEQFNMHSVTQIDIAQAISVVIVTVVSYLTQMHFTFKVKKDPSDITQLPE